MFDPASPAPSSARMFLTFAKLVVPAILTNVMFFVCQIAMLIFAGTLEDPVYVAVVGLTGTTCAIMVLSLLIGLNSAQETLTSQAFGAKNLRLCGLYLNRGTLILVAFFIPLALIPFIFGETIFMAIGQDARVSRLTAI